MTEHVIDLRKLVKGIESEIIMSDEQIDENGKVLRYPVIIFATGGERIGYISIRALQSWIMHHIYAPEIKVLEKRAFPSTY